MLGISFQNLNLRSNTFFMKTLINFRGQKGFIIEKGL